MAADKEYDKLIRYLYEHSGLPKNDIYLAINETGQKHISRQHVRDVLFGKERGIVAKGKMGFSERKHTFKYVLKLTDEGMQRETKLLRKNYVLNGIMRTNTSPKKFQHDVRVNVANILLTDNT